jgi:dTDP-4-amino-4,6-dideoxygalactose transaminase
MNRAVKDDVLAQIAETIDSGTFTNGEPVREFELAFASYCSVEHCVGVSSGLDGLRLSLLASGLEPGAGVVVPAGTFAATFEAVIQAGGTPAVVDIAEADYNLDISQLEAIAGIATHVLPVHLYGQMVDMRKLVDVAAAHGIQIIEDACQAHGARRDGLRPGQLTHAATFSFYPAKNLGAMGDAGAVVTNDPELGARIRALREHGERHKYHHDFVGYTARLDTLQAIVLCEKLRFLDTWNEQRRDVANYYVQALSGVEGLRLPSAPQGSDHVWHLFVVRTVEPERLGAFLEERGVHTARHYPEPPHLAPAYRSLGFAPGDFPVAESLAREALSLPLFPGMTETQLEWVCQGIRDYFNLDARSAAARLA